MATDPHSLTLGKDFIGWHVGRCACGWLCPATPDADAVSESYAEHVGRAIAAEALRGIDGD